MIHRPEAEDEYVDMKSILKSSGHYQTPQKLRCRSVMEPFIRDRDLIDSYNRRRHSDMDFKNINEAAELGIEIPFHDIKVFIPNNNCTHSFNDDKSTLTIYTGVFKYNVEKKKNKIEVHKQTCISPQEQKQTNNEGKQNGELPCPQVAVEEENTKL